MPYFRRLDQHRFLATEACGGAWDQATQHIAPALGLLVHEVERDRDRRRSDGLAIGRLTYDILGTVPVAEVDVSVQVIRAGRTIELVEARLRHAERDVVVLRAWLMQRLDTTTVEGTPLGTTAPPDDLPVWDPTSLWPGGFIRTVEVRRQLRAPGEGSFWVRTGTPLVDDEPVSDLARLSGLLDIANGMTVRVPPTEVLFPNVDLTVHLFREPHGEWLGFESRVSFGPDGLGLTSSVLHDGTGPVGSLAQLLTVRPLAQP